MSIEVLSSEIEKPLTEGFAQRLANIRELSDVGDQYLCLSWQSAYSGSYVCPNPDGRSIKDVDALIDFAMDPESSPSLIVRAQALCFALDILGRNPDLDQESIVRKFIKDPGLKKYHSVVDAGRLTINDIDSRFFEPGLYVLGIKEGIPHEVLCPDLTSFGIGDCEVEDVLPVKAIIFLEGLSRFQYEVEDSRLPLDNVMRLMPFALELQAALERNDFIGNNVQTDMRHDSLQIKYLLESDHPKAPEYIRSIRDLRAMSHELPQVFSYWYSMGIYSGMNALISDCVYAINHHLTHEEKTQIELPLNGDPDNLLKLDLKGDYLLNILKDLQCSIRTLIDVVCDPETLATRVNKSDQFAIFRFWDKEFQGSKVSLYIRPEGGISFDPSIEYGRNGEGVEASVSFNVSLPPFKRSLPLSGKPQRGQVDDRVSIRIDREGIVPADRVKYGVKRDPTREDGTLSLDIGSILGNPDAIGTRIGRVLAWGNLLRSKKLNKHAGLNHAKSGFTPEMGGAKEFSRRAKERIELWDNRRPTLAELTLALSKLAGVT